MKTFKSLQEMRTYNSAKARRSHLRRMSDPLKAEVFRVKRRKYERQRYKELLKDLE